ncbi:3,4-dihydroxy-2-butanone 4-phosphate synthase (plasmid) [Paracoccaceae bacterium]|nr:3,4-dihydroxy-2-butanone 4-phosphate synthase [Paracoccaceae bacterium]
MLRLRQTRFRAPSATGLPGAIRRLRQAEPVLIEDQHRQFWMVLPAAFATEHMLAHIRRDAGGLMCLALDRSSYAALGLPDRQDAHAAGPDIEMGCAVGRDMAPQEQVREVLDALHNRAPLSPPEDSAKGLPTMIADDGLMLGRAGIAERCIALLSAAGLPPQALMCAVLDSAGRMHLGAESIKGTPLARYALLTLADQHGLKGGAGGANRR